LQATRETVKARIVMFALAVIVRSLGTNFKPGLEKWVSKIWLRACVGRSHLTARNKTLKWMPTYGPRVYLPGNLTQRGKVAYEVFKLL